MPRKMKIWLVFSFLVVGVLTVAFQELQPSEPVGKLVVLGVWFVLCGRFAWLYGDWREGKLH